MTTCVLALWCSMLAVTADDKEGGGDIPKKVQELAAPKAAKAFSTESDRSWYTSGFTDGFKSGLTSPKSTIKFSTIGNQNAYVTGAEEGRKAALAQPKKGANRITLVDFGYTKVTMTGSVRMDLEQWEFRPLGTKAVWWFSLLARGQDLDFALRESDEVVATMTGFLSPERKSGAGYGHFAAYKREFIVTKVKDIQTVKAKTAK